MPRHKQADNPAIEVPDDWLPIGSAPKTGVPVWLTDGSASCLARWRNTRRYDPPTLTWKPTGFWVIQNQSGNQAVPFEPVGWKVYDPAEAWPTTEAARQ